jgi:pyruvate,water dikinase
LGQSFASFMARFGHYSSSGNDFSQVPWREQDDLVMQMIANYRAPGGVSEGIGWDDLPSSAQQRRLLRFAFRRARQFRRYREAINYHYTFGYGLFRNYFLALGARLADRGLLSGPEDVFYLSWDETRDLVKAGSGAQPAGDLVAQRRESVLAARDIILPDIIYGDQPPPVETATQVSKRLGGVPTSRGYYQGRVQVIESVEQFDQVEPGRVIVIPYSDVSWTPLIARAGAVVAESGGVLSHSSIVAREYNLPAVVSVTGACRLLEDRMLVTVDGFKGEIIIHDNERKAAR